MPGSTEGSNGVYTETRMGFEVDGMEIKARHDFASSYQAATGANGYIIGKSLGHRSQQSTAIYARLNLDPVRASVNKATDAMFEYMQPQGEAVQE